MPQHPLVGKSVVLVLKDPEMAKQSSLLTRGTIDHTDDQIMIIKLPTPVTFDDNSALFFNVGFFHHDIQHFLLTEQNLPKIPVAQNPVVGKFVILYLKDQEGEEKPDGIKGTVCLDDSQLMILNLQNPVSLPDDPVIYSGVGFYHSDIHHFLLRKSDLPSGPPAEEPKEPAEVNAVGQSIEEAAKRRIGFIG